MPKLISPANGCLLYRQMAAASRHGLPFADLFAILSEDDELLGADGPVAPLLASALQGGLGLADAMARLPEIFSAATVDLLRAAERRGLLAESLDTLADEQNDLAHGGAAMRTALLWPTALLVVAVLVLAVVMIFVVPAFKEMFTSFGADLPAPTLLLMAISDGFVDYWWLLAAALTALAFARRRKLLPPSWGLQVERLVLAVPFVRNYVVRAFGARLTRWLALFSATPELLVPALRHVEATIAWRVLRELCAELTRRLDAGQSLGQSLDHLPPLPRRLGLQLRLGEKIGDVSQVLAQAIDTAELELSHALMRYQRGMFLSAYLAIGVLVGFVVISLYLPIFKLGSVV
ncbi:MAG: type secretion system protein [Proteobacteria bacterium]|nr:type secretion system protein [Pseudomonadota bacterium]MBS1230940.1 type secretion system protein [Pseudomonadota bacterium]